MCVCVCVWSHILNVRHCAVFAFEVCVSWFDRNFNEVLKNDEDNTMQNKNVVFADDLPLQLCTVRPLLHSSYSYQVQLLPGSPIIFRF